MRLQTFIPASTSTDSTPAGEYPVWLHGVMSKDASIALVDGQDDGTYFVFERPKDSEYVLVVVFKSKVTHHMMRRNGDGIWSINNQAVGGVHKSVSDAIAALQKPNVPKWPVALSNPRAMKPGAKQPTRSVGGGGGSAQGAADGTPPARPAKKSGGGSSGDGGGAQEQQPSKKMKSQPTWLHGGIGKDTAEDLVNSDGGGDGTFLIWERSKTEYAMTVIYRGKPTHHLIKKDQATKEYMVGKTKFAGVKNLYKLVEKLSGPPSKTWPVQLQDGVRIPPGGESPQNKFWERMSTRKKSTKKSKEADAPPPSQKTSEPAGSGSTTSPEWLHGELSKTEAETLVMSGDASDGTYLVWERSSAPAAYGLTVIYNGKATHHAISRTDQVKSGGSFVVNKKPIVTGDAATTLVGVVTALQGGKLRGWPVALSTVIKVPDGGKKPTHSLNSGDNGGGDGGGGNNGGGDAPPIPAKKAIAGTTEEDSSTDNGHVQKQIDGVTDSSSSSDRTATKSISGTTTSATSTDGGESPGWLHGQITKEEAASKVMASGGVDGTYLVWLKDPPSAYALTVVYKGKASHHMVQQPNGSDTWQINKKAYNSAHKDLQKFVEMFQSPLKGWPVLLSTPVLAESAARPTPAPAEKEKANPPTLSKKPSTQKASSSKAGLEWLHGNLGKEEAQSKVMASGGVDGTYLVWSKNPPKQYVLTVVFRGKASHHLIEKPPRSDTWQINKKPYNSSHKDLQEFVEMFQSPVKGWPVPLAIPIFGDAERASTESNEESDTVTPDDPGSTIKEEDGGDDGEAPPPALPPRSKAASEAEEKAKDDEMNLAIDGEAVAEGMRPIGEDTVKSDMQTMGSALDALLSGTVAAGGTGSKNPVWLHGKLSKTKAQELVSEGARKDGTFLIWERDTSPDEYGLTVMFNNKPTHHLLTKDEAGKHWLVNKKTYGGQKYLKLGGMVDALALHVKGWPVPLIHPVAVPKEGGKLPTTFVEGHEATAAEEAAEYRDSAGKKAPSPDSKKGAGKRPGRGQFEGTADGDKRTVTITKDEKGFGFKFDTMKKTGSYLSLVKPKSVAAKSGGMVAGQKIISINGTEIAGFKKVDISELIRAGDTVTLELVQDFAGYSERRVKKKLKDAAGNPQIVTAKFAPHLGDVELVGGGDAATPVWVHAVADRSTAADTGYFAKGMRVLMINGAEMPESITADECIGKICHGVTVELKLAYSGKNYERYLKDMGKRGKAVEASSSSVSATAGAKLKPKATASTARRSPSAAGDGGGIDWMPAPSEPNELRKYLQTRPSIYYSLERDPGAAWGLEWSTAGGKLAISSVAAETAASYYELFEGDIVLEINNVDSVHMDAGGAKRLANANDYLELLIARADIGGVTMQAQSQLRRNPNQPEAAQGIDAGGSIVFDSRFIAGGEGTRYAEEYHFPATGFYEDE